MPAATQALLEDAYADIEAWLADEVETAFAAQESAAFVTGKGSSEPTGFLDYAIVAEASHGLCQIAFVAGNFSHEDAADHLSDLLQTPKSQFRTLARFVINRCTVSAAGRLKDADGRYVWPPVSAAHRKWTRGCCCSAIRYSARIWRCWNWGWILPGGPVAAAGRRRWAQPIGNACPGSRASFWYAAARPTGAHVAGTWLRAGLSRVRRMPVVLWWSLISATASTGRPGPKCQIALGRRGPFACASPGSGRMAAPVNGFQSGPDHLTCRHWFAFAARSPIWRSILIPFWVCPTRPRRPR